MVTALGRGGRRGASTLGCLFSLVLFLGTIYYGSQVGVIYWRLFELRDSMRQVARFSQNQTDEQVRRLLVSQVREIGLPPEATQFRIRRTGRPSRIVIETTYTETLHLPLIDARVIRFSPRVEHRY